MPATRVATGVAEYGGSITRTVHSSTALGDDTKTMEHTELCEAITAVCEGDPHLCQCACHTLHGPFPIDIASGVDEHGQMTYDVPTLGDLNVRALGPRHPGRRATDLTSAQKSVIHVSLVGLSMLLDGVRKGMGPEMPTQNLVQLDLDIERCNLARSYVWEA